MDKLKNQQGGLLLKVEDYAVMLQDRDALIQKSILNSLIGGNPDSSLIQCILTGLVESSVGGSITISNGYFFDGVEIFFVTGGTFTYNDGNHYWFSPDFTDTELRQFHDGDSRYCYQLRRYNVEYAGSGQSGWIDTTNMKRFNELLSEQLIFPEAISSPCTGTKYLELRKAIKYVSLSPLVDGNIYFITLFRNATGSGLTKSYEISIAKTISLNDKGTVVGVFRYNTTDILSGTRIIGIVPASSLPAGTSGISGLLVIDFDELTINKVYTCSVWHEGSLMSICSPANTEGSSGSNIITLDNDSTPITGGGSLIFLNADHGNFYLDDPGNVNGEIKLKNISESTATINSPTEHGLDGLSSINLQPMKCVTIIAKDDRFFVTMGNYS